jgi:hypothetical protein
MRLKPGVSLRGVKPETVAGMHIADGVCNDRFYELVITSVTDGKHSPNSLHYVGYAFDMRTRYAFDMRTRGLPQVLQNNLAADLREALGQEFDVVLEKTHIHVEFQPKGEA